MSSGVAAMRRFTSEAHDPRASLDGIESDLSAVDFSRARKDRSIPRTIALTLVIAVALAIAGGLLYSRTHASRPAGTHGVAAPVPRPAQ